MSGATGPDAERKRAGLAYVCAHRQLLHDDLISVQPATGAPEPVALLDELNTAFTDGTDYQPFLDAIHTALQTAGDALGLYGRINPDWSRSLRPAGVTSPLPPPSQETVYLCPTSQCSRHAWPAPGDLPLCTFTGRTLREDRL